jgi:DNA-binding MarR family transcriptional regulator
MRTAADQRAEARALSAKTSTSRWIRPDRSTRATPEPVLSRAAARCLHYVAEHPGASGVDVSRGAGISHASQVSRQLARLQAQGLVRRQSNGATNAWELTERGGTLVGHVRWEMYR